MNKIMFQDNDGTFKIKNPENYSDLYLPLAGEAGLKSCITPNLGGDSKTDQNHFLLEPVSAENLHNNRNTRNFWCRIEGTGNVDGKQGIWSLGGISAQQEADKFTKQQDESELEAGFMWQTLTRTSEKYGLQSKVTSFVPVDGNTEVSLVEIKNISEETMELTMIASIPIYGRSADNIRDHRHVTSLLHRIHVSDNGMEVTPVLSFDERGHQKNNTTYYVCGKSENGDKPVKFFPTVEMFLGEGGTYLNPEAVRIEKEGAIAGTDFEGKEVAGALQFQKVVLKAGEKITYIVLAGICEKDVEKVKSNISEAAIEKYGTVGKVEQAFTHVKNYWTKKVNVAFHTGDKEADNYMKWICFQPILRRIYGCSFLPYHDYGKGGRGWRDLWQDCLALLMMDPSGVRQMIVSNYGGERMDGTNATIIGSKQGEFIADRNNIVRVWMDHAYWPFVTTKLYIDQTGDVEVLLEKAPYFENQHFGTILEHVLLQNLCAFYDVGDHNQMRLHGADWNDALDMAWERGESVAFTCAYAGNLKEIAAVIRSLEKKAGMTRMEVAHEMECLFETSEKLYEDKEAKQKLLKAYRDSCENQMSGTLLMINLEDVAKNLEEKAQWLMEHIRKQEWVEDAKGNGWVNGYYDNHGNRVEGIMNGDVRMMLTSQVFAIMSGTATKEQVKTIAESADKYLYDRQAGGYRLNTNFHEEKFDLGRMFGFAYGEKENGAVFSHMTVMYANALYRSGFAEEGYKAIKTLLDTAMDFDRSKMYPGLPEYFNVDGRGLYAYLTGAASWFMMTMMTESFGVRGKMGDLHISPALMQEQFDESGTASVTMEFAGRTFTIRYENPERLLYGSYKIKNAVCEENELEHISTNEVYLRRDVIERLAAGSVYEIRVVLEAN